MRSTSFCAASDVRDMLPARGARSVAAALVAAAVWAAALLGMATPASAGPWSERSRRGAPVADRRVAQADEAKLESKRHEIVQRIRAVRARKLTDVLGLDTATAAALFPILDRHDESIARLVQEIRTGRKELRQRIRAGGSTSADFDARIDRLMALQRQLWERQEARFRDARKVLSPQQAALLFVALPEIDKKLYRQVRRAIQKDKKGRSRERNGLDRAEP